MRIEYTQKKREATLKERGLDFEDAAKILKNNPLVMEDIRKAYPERRFNALGELDGRLVHVTFCIRDFSFRIISMRHAKLKERRQYEEARNHRP